MTLRLGYVVKRFPRASETFIAQEVLELERLGAEVHLLTLWPNDAPAAHGWLEDLDAPITHCGDLPLSHAWKWLHRTAAESDDRDGCEEALAEAFRFPDRRGRHRLREAAAVARAAGALELRHLHAHFANDPAFVAYLAHLASRIPFSFTAHAKDIYAKTLPAALLRRVVAASAFVVTVSEDNRRHLAGRLGPTLGSRVLRLYNGVDLERIAPASDPPPPFGIVCVARHVEKKGIDGLLRSLALLDRRGIAYRCTLIGDGADRADLEALAARLGVAPRVRFTGTLAHEAVVAELRRHHVLVLPARVARDGDRDALPTVLLEAMAAGLPCLSTGVGGIPEIIVHRETGLLLPVDQPFELAEALVELAASRELRDRLGRAARRRAERLFDRRTNVARLHEWLSLASREERVVPAARALRAVEG